MRMLMMVQMPHARFNAAVKDGSAGPKIQKILADLKPESAYFAEFDGRRTGFLIVNLDDVAKIPALAEPWFLNFEADVHIRPAMTPEDLARGGLDTLAKKWA